MRTLFILGGCIGWSESLLVRQVLAHMWLLYLTWHVDILQSDCFHLEEVDEGEEYHRLKQSMEMVGFSAVTQARWAQPAYLKHPCGLVVNAADFRSQGPGFESHWRQNSAHNYTMCHCTEPFIIILPPAWYDLNDVERDAKHQVIIINLHMTLIALTSVPFLLFLCPKSGQS